MRHNAGLWLANCDHVTQCWPLIGFYQHDHACQSSQPKPSILSSFLSQNVSFRLYCGNSSLFVSPPYNPHVIAFLSLSLVVQKLNRGFILQEDRSLIDNHTMNEAFDICTTNYPLLPWATSFVDNINCTAIDDNLLGMTNLIIALSSWHFISLPSWLIQKALS